MIIVALFAIGISLGLPELLSRFLPGICWSPRVGGLMIGCAVLIQGYIFANPNKFVVLLASGHTLEQRFMQVVYMITLFGTSLVAFGDLIPSAAGANACYAHPNQILQIEKQTQSG